MFKTVSLRILVILAITSFTVEAHRVYHRIHVPQKIKTIYHTKIIKVPEHHHYIHEKEKIVPVETHHHHTHHKDSYSNLRSDDLGLEYEQGYDKYESKEHDYENLKLVSDHIHSASKKVTKKSKTRPGRVKHRIIKIPPN